MAIMSGVFGLAGWHFCTRTTGRAAHPPAHACTDIHPSPFAHQRLFGASCCQGRTQRAVEAVGGRGPVPVPPRRRHEHQEGCTFGSERRHCPQRDAPPGMFTYGRRGGRQVLTLLASPRQLEQMGQGRLLGLHCELDRAYRQSLLNSISFKPIWTWLPNGRAGLVQKPTFDHYHMAERSSLPAPKLSRAFASFL